MTLNGFFPVPAGSEEGAKYFCELLCIRKGLSDVTYNTETYDRSEFSQISVQAATSQ